MKFKLKVGEAFLLARAHSRKITSQSRMSSSILWWIFLVDCTQGMQNSQFPQRLEGICCSNPGIFNSMYDLKLVSFQIVSRKLSSTKGVMCWRTQGFCKIAWLTKAAVSTDLSTTSMARACFWISQSKVFLHLGRCSGCVSLCNTTCPLSLL